MKMPNLEFVESHGLFYEGGKSPLTFFQDCLEESIEYKRAAGYFSSSVFLAVNESLSKFLDRNGVIYLVCSPRLMPEDIEAIKSGSQSRLISQDRVIAEIHEMLENPMTRSTTKILGHLVASGNLEIRIAIRTDLERGMFHSKVGIFRDSFGGKVAFVGSTNETWSGWSDYGNAESFIAKSTYRGPESEQDVAEIEKYFDQLWSNNLPGLTTSSLSDAPTELLVESARGESLTDLIQDAKMVLERYPSNLGSSAVSKRPMMEHQINVLSSWRENNFVGIIDHATGSGKTITALNAIKEWISTGRPALVIVPSSLLQKQWREEIKTEIAIEPLLAGGNSTNRSVWMQLLSDKTRKDKDFGPRITLAVLNSASSEDFVKRIQISEDLLVVVDEVHTIGQKQSINLLLKIKDSGGRLGLSATYQRYGDAEGTSRIEDVFKKALEPTFTIKDAIKSGRLVPYEYYFGQVNLLDEEAEKYEELSDEIRALVAREGDKDFSKYSSYLKTLIFKRAGILKGAKNKTPFATDVLKNNYRTGDRWLVYCDDRQQMDDVEKALIKSELPILKYFDAMGGDKNETLQAFASQGGVLLAIKCLDEGIDIPSATHALILASSQNPREYVQRRGRVLRSDKATGKYKAVIWDVIVTDQDRNPINVSEIERMKEFAQDASNTAISVEIMDLISRIMMRDSSIDVLTEGDLDFALGMVTVEA